jgi:pilus assembly protein CpaE
MRILDRYVLSLNQAQNGNQGGAEVLLICPSSSMSTELAQALSAELPTARLLTAARYPSRAEASQLAAKAEVCLLDVGSDAPSATTVLGWLGAVAPGMPVISLLSANDPDLILKCLRGGADDFLIQPFTADQLRAVLKKLSRVRAGLAVPAERGGKVICVMPGKGASGATTVACNLAFALRRLGGGKVLLADLDGLTGTVAFVLKLKSTYSFVDAVTHSGVLDQDVWRVLVTPSRGIDVLLSPESPVDCYSEPLDPAGLVASSRQGYDYVVLDSGGAHGDWNQALARLSDELVLVTTNELPALHATQRALAHLERSGVGRAKPHTVLNRYLARLGLPEDAIARALGSPVYATLPSDYEGLQRALLAGQPAPPSTAFGHSVAALARALAGAAKPGAGKAALTAGLRGPF